MSGTNTWDMLEPLRRPTTVNKIHESVYRSWHVLYQVERLVQNGAPAVVILSYIESMRESERKEEQHND